MQNTGTNSVLRIGTARSFRFFKTVQMAYTFFFILQGTYLLIIMFYFSSIIAEDVCLAVKDTRGHQIQTTVTFIGEKGSSCTPHASVAGYKFKYVECRSLSMHSWVPWLHRRARSASCVYVSRCRMCCKHK